MRAPIPEVFFYHKAECELCEQMARELNAWRKTYARKFRVRKRDVETSAEWFARYAHLLPVLEIDGAAVCEYFFDAGRFAIALQHFEMKKAHA